jgi:hypothetical protein
MTISAADHELSTNTSAKAHEPTETHGTRRRIEAFEAAAPAAAK